MTAAATAGDWNEVKSYDPSWVYSLRPGYEIRLCPSGRRKRPAAPIRFERMLNKNLSCVDAAGMNWRIPPSNVTGWRAGKASDLTKLQEERPAAKFLPDTDSVHDLKPGDPVLLILSPTQIYVGFFERLSPSTLHYRDLNGKPYRITQEAFICKLPPERFRG